MKRIATLALVTLVAAALAAPAMAASVQVVGLQVMKPRPAKTANPMGESYVMGVQPGVTIHLHVADAGRKMLSLDREASKLESFTDDQGASLAPDKPDSLMDHWLGSWPKFSDDKHSCILQVRTDKLPDKGATTIRVKGTLAIICGSDEKDTEAKNVRLRKGSGFRVGGQQVKISDTGKASYGGMKMTVTLQSSESFEAIQNIEFVDADGKTIKSRRQQSSRSGFGGKRIYSVTYGLAESPNAATIKIKYFGKMETLKAPLDITVGAGL